MTDTSVFGSYWVTEVANDAGEIRLRYITSTPLEITEKRNYNLNENFVAYFVQNDSVFNKTQWRLPRTELC